MKISITGASGDIGGTFLEYMYGTSQINALIRADKQITVPDRRHIERFAFQDGYTYSADFLNRFTESDAVVHFAALLNVVEDTASELNKYIATNAMLTGLLAAASAHQKTPPKFIYISSELIYLLNDDEAMKELRTNFIAFCNKHLFPWDVTSYDLRALAAQFIEENKNFPFLEVNIYALTKYLGEAIALSARDAAIVRLTCAYGPEYDNPRLIQRLAIGRLSGNGAVYIKEPRDFVYSADVNKLLSAIVHDNITGIIDCKSGEITKTQDLKNMIIRITPAAHGKLKGVEQVQTAPSLPIKPAGITLTEIIGSATPFSKGLAETLRQHNHPHVDQYSNMLPGSS